MDGVRGECLDLEAAVYIYMSLCMKKTNNLGFRPGPTQTSLYSHRSRLETCTFGFKKKRNCTIRVAKTKALISFAVTEKIIL